VVIGSARLDIIPPASYISRIDISIFVRVASMGGVMNEHPAPSPSAIVARGTAVAAAVGIALLVGADVIAKGQAAGHVRYHAVVALVVLAISVVLARRAGDSWRPMGPSMGLGLLAFAQLVEAVGGAGFDAANETRNGLAVIHDLGIGLTSLGIVAAILGIAVGIWDALARRGIPRGIAVGGGVAILVLGAFAVKMLIGF
jgi:hypothetical protein